MGFAYQLRRNVSMGASAIVYFEYVKSAMELGPMDLT